MSDLTLHADTGRTLGTRPSRRLRAEGRIPAVIYGHGGTPVSLSVDRRELRVALSTGAGANALLTLEVDGRRELAMVKDMQRHPVRRTVTHVDFLRVDVNESVEVEVPLVLQGEAREVRQRDGLIDPALDTVTVRATPGNIPDAIVVDISGMQIGDIIRVRDLVMPAGVTTTLDPDTPAVTAEATGGDEDVVVEEPPAEEG